MKTFKNVEYNDGLGIENMNSEELDKFINEVCEDLSPSNNFKEILNTKNYEFEIKGKIYNIEIVESITHDNKRIISIKFKLMNNPNAPHRDDFHNDHQYQIALQKSQIGITGTGDGMAVFKSVIGAIINAIKKIQPDYVTFNADENNRQGLYLKIIKTIEKYIPFKYKILNIDPVSGYELGSEEFWIEILKSEI